MTLPRFDLMAQLDSAPNGMTLGELSQRMMVSNGNVTGLVERLVAEGLVDRRPRRTTAARRSSASRRTGAERFPRAWRAAHEATGSPRFSPASTPNGDRDADGAAGQDQASRRARRSTSGDVAMMRMTPNPVAAAARRATRRSMSNSSSTARSRR